MYKINEFGVFCIAHNEVAFLGGGLFVFLKIYFKIDHLGQLRQLFFLCA